MQVRGTDQRLGCDFNYSGLNFSNRTKRSADESSCGLSDSSIEEWMKKVQNSAVEEPLLVIGILNCVLFGI